MIESLDVPVTFQWWKDYNFVQKDRTESQRLRNLGNQVYQKNKLHEALDFYNQSICLAPHPPPPNAFLMHPVEPHDEGFTHEELALGYANRSAVLFQVILLECCNLTEFFEFTFESISVSCYFNSNTSEIQKILSNCST